jgi:hypothetical protein
MIAYLGVTAAATTTAEFAVVANALPIPLAGVHILLALGEGESDKHLLQRGLAHRIVVQSEPLPRILHHRKQLGPCHSLALDLVVHEPLVKKVHACIVIMRNIWQTNPPAQRSFAPSIIPNSWANATSPPLIW